MSGYYERIRSVYEQNLDIRVKQKHIAFPSPHNFLPVSPTFGTLSSEISSPRTEFSSTGGILKKSSSRDRKKAVSFRVYNATKLREIQGMRMLKEIQLGQFQNKLQEKSRSRSREEIKETVGDEERKRKLFIDIAQLNDPSDEESNQFQQTFARQDNWKQLQQQNVQEDEEDEQQYYERQSLTSLQELVSKEEEGTQFQPLLSNISYHNTSNNHQQQSFTNAQPSQLSYLLRGDERAISPEYLHQQQQTDFELAQHIERIRKAKRLSQMTNADERKLSNRQQREISEEVKTHLDKYKSIYSSQREEQSQQQQQQQQRIAEKKVSIKEEIKDSLSSSETSSPDSDMRRIEMRKRQEKSSIQTDDNFRNYGLNSKLSRYSEQTSKDIMLNKLLEQSKLYIQEEKSSDKSLSRDLISKIEEIQRNNQVKLRARREQALKAISQLFDYRNVHSSFSKLKLRMRQLNTKGYRVIKLHRRCSLQKFLRKWHRALELRQSEKQFQFTAFKFNQERQKIWLKLLIYQAKKVLKEERKWLIEAMEELDLKKRKRFVGYWKSFVKYNKVRKAINHRRKKLFWLQLQKEFQNRDYYNSWHEERMKQVVFQKCLLNKSQEQEHKETKDKASQHYRVYNMKRVFSALKDNAEFVSSIKHDSLLIKGMDEEFFTVQIQKGVKFNGKGMASGRSDLQINEMKTLNLRIID